PVRASESHHAGKRAGDSTAPGTTPSLEIVAPLLTLERAARPGASHPPASAPPAGSYPIAPQAEPSQPPGPADWSAGTPGLTRRQARSEEHTSELQSRFDLVCRLLLEKKNTNHT